MRPVSPRTLLPLGVALAAILAAAIVAALALPAHPLLPLAIAGAAAAAYMAINIGANDVANNVGPAVGAKALKMGTALLLAAAFDVAGAVFAGHGVIKTISQDLLALQPAMPDRTLVLMMITATLAGALWINGSTFFGAPVSTTHAIVGAMVGSAIAAAGMDAVHWPMIGTIAVSWTLSPLFGGLLSAALHAFIRLKVTHRTDKLAAARRWVPILTGIMAGIFALYLQLLGASSRPWPAATGVSFGTGFLFYLLAVPWVRRRSRKLENRKKQVARLFRPPLIGAAALLSFAHGANDVANAVAPFSAIVAMLQTTPPATALSAPFWVIGVGALGIAVGIVLFGPRVIHTVGEQITKLNEIRAFCVALAAAITVLAATALRLPVSSTHVAVGAVFGVGFLREYLAIRNMTGAAVPVETQNVDVLTLNDTPEQAIARERRGERRYLVRRLKIARIGFAWLVTLPASALVAALVYGLLDWIIAGAGA